MRSMTVPMPSPNGTNHEGLFLRTRIMTRAAMAYDAMPKEGVDDLMKMRDQLQEFLQNILSREDLEKTLQIFDTLLDEPVRATADNKRGRGYDNEAMRTPLAERQAQAMDSRTVRGGSSSYSSFLKRHPELAHIKPV